MRGRALPASIALAILLAAALAFRVWIVLNLQGHSGDVSVIQRWAERLAEVGPLQFYDGQLTVYPALLYLYWPLGVLLDDEALTLAIEAQSIPFDLALGTFLFLIAGAWGGAWRGLAAAALYLFNPAVLIAGPMWGQVDAAGTLLFLGALVAAARSRLGLAGALAVLAGMVKPQFGLVVLPVTWLAVAEWRRGRRRAAVGALGGGLLAYVVVAAPLLLDPLRYADQLYEIGNSKPLISAGAPNPWGMLFGYSTRDGALLWVGLALLVAGLALALLPLRRGRDLATLLTVGVLVAFAFYFLPTRVHERYLFPVLALLAPFAVLSWRVLGAYAVLSVAFGASLLAALSRINPPSVPEPFREILLSPAAPWVMGTALVAAALATTWLLVRRSSAPAPMLPTGNQYAPEAP